MPARAVVVLRFDDASDAMSVGQATQVDNPRPFCRQHVKGRVLTFEAQGPSLASLRETLDDWLRCAATAAQAAARAR